MHWVERGKLAAVKTIIVQGAPGAGKSSLLSNLTERYGDKIECPQFLELPDEILKDSGKLALEIVKKIAPGEAKQFRQKNIATSKVSEGISGITSGEVSTTRETDAEDI